ncbi:MAG TPA: hypothetical protein VMO26_28860 [Vicinamibacterales bacterium]|nr:hypothetical protein [Vicinamibacterales bacterium]
MDTPKLLLIGTLLVASGAGCAKARANTEPILMPELLPPPPPPRIVETLPAEPVPTIEPSPVESALSIPPPRIPAAPPAKPEPPKTETAPEPPERPAPGAPTLTLKPGPGVQAQTEASIRAHLDRALHDLQRVKYAALNADGRTQYDTARNFIQQAEEALKAANLTFAGKLADKAATMAAVLVR